ncbi:putative PurR-regulated permease PerM [Bradyrhizobium sp. USDA 3397]
MVAVIPPLHSPSVPLDVDLPDPHAAAVDARNETEMPLPSDPRTFFLGGLFGLGVLAALYVASSIILPVMVALVLNLLLQPAVPLLGRLHLPRAVGALFTVLLVIGALVGLVAALSVPATTWAERLPEGIPRLEAHLRLVSGPIQALQKVIQQAEQAADAPPGKGSIVSVRRDLGITGVLFAGTRSVLDGLFTTVLVLYFLLVAGNIFLRRVVEILPTFSNKRQAVDISQQIQEDISGYLLTITAMNAGVGVTTAAAMYLCGLGDPLLWATTAFLLNYIPILGPLFGVAHLCAGRNAELRELVVGLAAAGALLWHSSRRGRNLDAPAACAALHAKPGADYPVAGVLVLDVGRAGCDLGCADAGYSEDRLRQVAPP